MQIFIYSILSEDLRKKLIAGIEGHGVKLVFDSEAGEKGREMFLNSEIVLGNPPKSWFESGVPKLKFWQLDSAGFNQYKDVNTTAVVANMGDYFSVPCAETMVAGILSFYRQIPDLIRLQQQSKWIGTPLRDRVDLLTGKRVLILGAGSIAGAIEKMLKGFDCPVNFMARHKKSEAILTYDEVILKLSDFDIVINTLPGNADNVVGNEFFDGMMEGTLYASVGRGNTTDEDSLVEALTSGKLSGAVLDVTKSEPLPENHIFWKMPNVILTQHTGGGQKNEDDGKVKLLLSNLKKFMKNKLVEHQIDLRKGY
jgi:glyoxylate/hydroxypyruvate reductase